MNKNIFSNIDSIKSDKNTSDSISFQKLNIDKYEKEIEEYEKDIEKKHKDEISLIIEIRKIKENEKNHIDNIICNDLKDDKQVEYTKKKRRIIKIFKIKHGGWKE